MRAVIQFENTNVVCTQFFSNIKWHANKKSFQSKLRPFKKKYQGPHFVLRGFSSDSVRQKWSLNNLEFLLESNTFESLGKAVLNIQNALKNKAAQRVETLWWNSSIPDLSVEWIVLVRQAPIGEKHKEMGVLFDISSTVWR